MAMPRMAESKFQSRRQPYPGGSGPAIARHDPNRNGRLWTSRGNRDKTDFMSTPNLTIRLAAPRGFCAGVDRAIQIVEKSLEKHGAPVYVRHEIVHNRHVVEGLEAKGAIFVEELDEVPDDAPVIFSAHGVPKSVPAEASRRKMTFVDATCPLVSKVHLGAGRHHRAGRHILLIGHEGHPEVIGTMGQLSEGAITLVETVDQARVLEFPTDAPLAYITQTTLSVDDTAEIIAVLRERFPKLKGPTKEDICYATTNRQNAVKAIAEKCDAVLVLGAPNSSNSKRLVEVAALNGCPDSRLIQNVDEVDWDWLAGKHTLGITAGASAPEVLVEAVIVACQKRFNVTLEEVEIAREDVRFKLPSELVA
jgi:4-hydroxy-3-methylbut-2-enyl diphosphate reductase